MVSWSLRPRPPLSGPVPQGLPAPQLKVSRLNHLFLMTLNLVMMQKSNGCLALLTGHVGRLRGHCRQIQTRATNSHFQSSPSLSSPKFLSRPLIFISYLAIQVRDQCRPNYLAYEFQRLLRNSG